MQGLELLRHPDRVSNFFGMSEMKNGTPIDQRLIVSGTTPDNVVVKPLKVINSTINTLRQNSNASVET